jgi:peptide/nickel transport system ATP-binding protein
VMYAGRGVEKGDAKEVLAQPSMPYTYGLLQSLPSHSEDLAELKAIQGSPPSLLNLPPGCSFHPRCEFKDQVPGDACWTQLPEWRPTPGLANRQLRCHLPDPVRTLQEDEGVR